MAAPATGWLHTLGNLTLTGYNSEYSDRPFTEKRDMEGGFKQSPLQLNAGLGQLDTGTKPPSRNAQDDWPIGTRGVGRARHLTRDAHRYKPASAGDKRLHDQRSSVSARPRYAVFEAFRKEVLALDPCVTEEFLKLYVAYKAETNFVDVVPQAKRLRLSLNMNFAEINDPKGLCRDVTDLGRWGNGDVEVGLSSLSELPYVMSLVRQSYERQMGDGGQA